ncbi:MAG: DUF432 domain-containing protein [Nitrososphaerales archaeon]|nr:DUF432 domain-containing protein [Nitrososphaerales archaeon]
MKKFGLYTIEDGFTIKFRNEQISLKKTGDDSYTYRRDHKGETSSKTVFSSRKGKVKLAIYPVRPIQMPRQLAHNIMVNLESPIALPPKSSVTHHLTMPIEIGVFTISKNSNYMIDAFSLSFPKYGLYGKPNMGYICRLHNSIISSEEKAVPYEEAGIIMKFQNKSADWVTVHKIVMDAYMVDLYLSGDTVYLEDSNLLIEDGTVASLFLNNKPPLHGLKEVPMAAESVKKFRLGFLERGGFGVEGKFVMEHGY